MRIADSAVLVKSCVLLQMYYDRLLNDITCTTTSCTADESRRYGRFLSETLALIARWHGSEDVFDKVSAGVTSQCVVFVRELMWVWDAKYT